MKINIISKRANKIKKPKRSDLWLPGQGELLEREVDEGS